jgi:hypothetical protein
MVLCLSFSLLPPFRIRLPTATSAADSVSSAAAMNVILEGVASKPAIVATAYMVEAAGAAPAAESAAAAAIDAGPVAM